MWSSDPRRHVTSRSRWRQRLDNRIVPCKLQQWDRYRVVHGLDSAVKVRLIKAYCLSLYGCELGLWDLCNSQIETICVAFRKGLSRCLDVPYYSHSFLLPGLTDTLPLFHEISKRSIRFLYKCMLSPSSRKRGWAYTCHSSLVRSVVLHSVHDMGCNSVMSRNIYSTCKLFGLSSGDFWTTKFWLAMKGCSQWL